MREKYKLKLARKAEERHERWLKRLQTKRVKKVKPLLVEGLDHKINL